MENNRNAGAGCAQLLKNVSEAAFCVTDLKLYLDTHPDDRTALAMFKEAAKNYKNCVDTFESRFYPLFATSADCDDNWEWLMGVWPGEKMM